jgi:anti-anti-sigma regulatory factor
MFEARHDQGALIVKINGSPDLGLLSRVLASLRTESRAVVLDLSEVLLIDPAIGGLLSEALGSTNGDRRFRIVCTRLSTRQLLRRWGLPEVIPLLATVEDALPAQVP